MSLLESSQSSDEDTSAEDEKALLQNPKLPQCDSAETRQRLCITFLICLKHSRHFWIYWDITPQWQISLYGSPDLLQDNILIWSSFKTDNLYVSFLKSQSHTTNPKGLHFGRDNFNLPTEHQISRCFTKGVGPYVLRCPFLIFGICVFRQSI